jgi:hypothetical protein
MHKAATKQMAGIEHGSDYGKPICRAGKRVFITDRAFYGKKL